MSVRRLHRLHFSSTPFFRRMAMSWPQWQRASDSSEDALASELFWDDSILSMILSFGIFEIENHSYYRKCPVFVKIERVECFFIFWW